MTLVVLLVLIFYYPSFYKSLIILRTNGNNENTMKGVIVALRMLFAQNLFLRV